MRRVVVRGSGRVRVAAYGLADAEHQVEKELGALWPSAYAEVLEVARGGEPRIVEEFDIRYQLRGALEVAAETQDEARREAFRVLRERFAGSRFAAVAWEAVPDRTGSGAPAE